MTPEQEDDAMVYMAAGLDPATAFVVASKEDSKPMVSDAGVDQGSTGKSNTKNAGCSFVLWCLMLVLVVVILRAMFCR
jgi:hypothetical protein